MMLAAVAPWFRLVRFSHSVFALPFALASAWLASVLETMSQASLVELLAGITDKVETRLS